MKRQECIMLLGQLEDIKASSRWLDFSNTYSDLFQHSTSQSGIESIEVGNFDDRYQKPASKGGKYPVRSDLNNIFTIGMVHGKRRLFGTNKVWESTDLSTFSGYPKYSVVMDENYNSFISTVNSNKYPLPKEGEKSSYWIPMKGSAGFSHRFGQNNEMFPRRKMVFDIERPVGYQTGHFLVKTFTGRDISLSGMAVFLNTDSEGQTFLNGRFGSQDVQEQESWHGTFKMKISTFPDIYENDEHSNSYIEIISVGQYVVYGGDNRYNQIFTKSDQKAIPISYDETYYLFVELENASIAGAPPEDPNRPFGCTYLAFPRTLSWPCSKKIIK